MANPKHLKEFYLNSGQVADLDYLTRNLSGLIADPKTPEHALFDEVGQYRQEARSMLPELSEALDNLAARNSNAVVTVHLPEATSDCYGPTPDHYPSQAKIYASDTYRALFAAMPQIEGEGREEGFYVYGNVALGGIHNNIIALRAEMDRRLGNSSDPSTDMCFHTDGVFQNLNQGHEADPACPDRNSSPDFLALHFIRNNERAHLQVAIPVPEELSDTTREILKQPVLNVNFSNQTHLKRIPILYGPDDDPWIRYNHREFSSDFDFVDDPDAQLALKELDIHLAERVQTVAVRAGSIVFLDNRRLLHNRPKYEALWDGNGRWQRRVSLSTSRARIEQFTVRPHLISTSLVRAVPPAPLFRGAESNPSL